MNAFARPGGAAPLPAAASGASIAGAPPAEAAQACAHCGQPAAPGHRFCCTGCAAAFELIQGLGLARYYERRILDPDARALRPDAPAATGQDTPGVDAPGDAASSILRRVTTRPDGLHDLTLAVDGLQCGACVWLIESVLAREPGLRAGRVNLSTRRLHLAWEGEAARGAALVHRIEQLGYRLVPFDRACLDAASDRTGRDLLRALAVAGFAAGNVMFLSIATWAGVFQGMGPGTRDMLHWIAALIALPAVTYAGMPFFRSATAVLRHGRTNMDVPISLGVIIVLLMSLAETVAGGTHVYFEAAASLVFFLLIGRVLDHRARGMARATAEQLLMLRASDVAVLADDGSISRRPQDQVQPGARVLVAAGERIGVDGTVIAGASSLDSSLVTGESLPLAVGPGATVHAGMLNLGEALTLRATATGGATLLAECVRLIDAAEQRRGRFVVLADRIARRYAPAVHLTALATFLLWWLVLHAPIADAAIRAAAVLIITCPCALALAIPAVQVIATGRLFRQGILLKSPTALERLASIDTVVFDKTGTLTEPTLRLAEGRHSTADLAAAATLAASSRHPLARALLAAAPPVMAAPDVVEHHGAGLSRATPEGDWRLGSRAFCGIADGQAQAAPELWLRRPGHPPVGFHFAEALRPDAAASLAALRRLGIAIHLLSGDHAEPVARIAATLGIPQAEAGCSPLAKVARIEALKAAGHAVLMVGDGLNDGPSLAAATVSASPSSAADISQNVADVVFQGGKLAAVPEIIATARRAQAVMRQNLGFALAYNLLMMPLAIAGLVTPWLAAAAMSSSSLAVMLNSLRMRRSTP